jgi:hypothetical protein
MADPAVVREQALELFSCLEDLEQPELLVMPVLLDAITIVEIYRRARHQVMHLPELTASVDALLKELEIIRRTNEWAKEPEKSSGPSNTG